MKVLGRHSHLKKVRFRRSGFIPDAADYYADILMPLHMLLLRYFGVLDEHGES